MIICMTHNHNYPHQVDGEGACPKCEGKNRMMVKSDDLENSHVETILSPSLVKKRLKKDLSPYDGFEHVKTRKNEQSD